jgi:hypothetical protein
MPSGFSLRSLFNIQIASRHAVHAAVLAAALTVGASVTRAAAAEPADAGTGEIETGKYQFEGTLSRPEYVRALPGDRFYPTMLLDKGSKVTVVGAKGDWLKIVPPEGSFSYVNRAFIERFGSGKQGRATAANLLVKAGSSLQPQMWITQTKLNPKDIVEILGEDDQFFKIKPPAGAFLYIPKDAVPAPKTETVQAPQTPVPAAPAAPVTPPVVPSAPVVPAPTDPVVQAPPAAPTTGPVASVTPTPGAPTEVPEAPAATQAGATLPGEAPEGPAGTAATPPAKPMTAVEAITALQELEARFKEATQKSLAEQPLADLTRGYEDVGATPGITDAAKRVVEIRLATLKVRTEALEQLKATQEQQKIDESKLTGIKGERDELKSRLAAVEIQQYTAVGTLRPSSLQVARTTLFRLTDPRTGRTLAYVWGTDPKIGTMVDQFVGVRGTLQTDARLQFKVISPTASEVVDPAKAYTAYQADIVPPSLMPRQAATTTTPEQ